MRKKTKKFKKGKEKKEKFIPQLLKGMKDVLPEESKYWRYVLEKMVKVAKSYGFEEIIVPVLEDANLFKRTIGESTDIVEKEMFTFFDKGKREVALRPELTAGIARAYIEHGLDSLPQPIKLFSFGPVFRYEKPQAGRQREFYQFNLEVLGSANPIIDSQLIALAHTLFKELKLSVEIQINSLGCKDCRKEYYKKLFEALRYKKKLLCENCQQRLNRSPLRIFDCKEKKCKEFTYNLPFLIDSICQSCKDHFIKVLENLDELQIPYNLNPRIVRGLDYYTRTIFEFWPSKGNLSEDEKSKFALGGGGRYDELIKYLGGKITPACGMAFGMERIIEEMKNQGVLLPKERKNIVFLTAISEPAKKKALSLFEELKEAKIEVKEALAKDSLRAQLDLANKIGARIVLILGQDEVAHKTIIIKDMKTGIQEVVDVNKIIAEIKKRL
jgi:histidyl-tRNA synthetase